MTRRLRLVPSPEAFARSFAELAAQAAEVAARLARRGEIDAALKAVAVARTMLEHVAGAERQGGRDGR
jgi:hypothetical protein